jgi:hypothetical protein
MCLRQQWTKQVGTGALGGLVGVALNFAEILFVLQYFRRNFGGISPISSQLTWNCVVPAKIYVFLWLVLHNTIGTRKFRENVGMLVIQLVIFCQFYLSRLNLPMILTFLLLLLFRVFGIYIMNGICFLWLTIR